MTKGNVNKLEIQYKKIDYLEGQFELSTNQLMFVLATAETGMDVRHSALGLYQEIHKIIHIHQRKY